MIEFCIEHLNSQTGLRLHRKAASRRISILIGLDQIPSSLDYALFPQLRINGSLERSIKVEVKKKHLSNGWPFPRFAAHVIEQDLF